MTAAPETITYASVMSRETVINALMIAVLNDHDVKFADILNVYVQTLVTEKVWTWQSHYKDRSYFQSCVLHKVCRSCLQKSPCELHEVHGVHAM